MSQQCKLKYLPLCILLLLCTSTSAFGKTQTPVVAGYNVIDLGAKQGASYEYNDSASGWVKGLWYKDISLFYFCDSPHVRPVSITNASVQLRSVFSTCGQALRGTVVVIPVYAAPAKAPKGLIAKLAAKSAAGAKLIAYNSAVGLSDGITDSHLSEKIDSLTDHFIKQVGTSGAAGLKTITDTLYSPTSLRKFIVFDSTVSAHLDNNLRHAIDQMIGDSSEHEMHRTIRGSIDEALSPETRNKVDSLITAAGKSSGTQLGNLLDIALGKVDTTFAHMIGNVKGAVSEANDGAKKWLKTVYIILGIVAGIAIIFLVACIYLFRSRSKYSTLTGVLTYQIEHMPPGISPQQFKAMIQSHAQSAEVEDFLHQQLVNKKMASPADEQKTTGATPGKNK